jgi:hypothetical protein
MVELRWAVPAETTTKGPRLQYRTHGGPGLGSWSDWFDVPHVVVQQEPTPAPTVSDMLTAAAGAPNEANCGICSGRGAYGIPGQRCAFCRGTGKVQWRSAPKDGVIASDDAQGGKA